MSGVLARRLVIVTGKGGVGKTMVAAAIAMAAARTGKRAAVAELYGGQRASELLGLPGRTYHPRKAAKNVDVLSLTPTECLDDFGRRKLKVGAVVSLLFHNRVMASFLDAVPGLHDLLQLGKLENLLFDPQPGDPRYDLVVVDAPATGHALTLLSGARAMGEMTRAGPFYELSRSIEQLLADRERSALVVVTLPEELPVNETLELIEALEDPSPDAAAAAPGMLAAVVINRGQRAQTPDAASWSEMRAALTRSDTPSARSAVQLGDDLVTRMQSEALAVERLTTTLSPRGVHIARLSEVGDGRVTPANVGELAAALVEQLGDSR